MVDVAGGGSHILATDVLHESGDKFSKATLRDEGIIKHYLRHVYLIAGMIIGVSAFVKWYQLSFQILPLYEDYLDWVLFEHVKRGRSVTSLGVIFYICDSYSVEGRSS